MKNTRILVFGDSITWGSSDEEGGWATRIKRYADKKNKIPGCWSPVYILGIPGDTTENLLNRFDQETKARLTEDDGEEAIMVIFAIGINDSQVELQSNKNKISPETFRSNIQTLIDHARKYTPQIVFVGLNPIEEEKVNPNAWMPTNAYISSEVEKYNDMIKQIAKEKVLDYIEIYNEFMKTDYKKFLFDGLHPNIQGHELIYNQVITYLQGKDCI